MYNSVQPIRAFITIQQLEDDGIKIESGTEIYNNRGEHVGDYDKHVKGTTVDYHVAAYGTKATFPITRHLHGIMVEAKYTIDDVKKAASGE